MELRANTGQKFVATEADRLWLARAVQAEGEPREAVAAALVNLHALRVSRGYRGALAETVRAYAQPVNPRWYPAGDLFRAARAAAAAAELNALDRQAEARERFHSTRTRFGAGTLAAVAAALAGRHRSDVTDYAAPSIDASKKGYEPRSEAEPGRNRLWSRAPGWGGYVAAAAGDGAAILALVLAFAAVWGVLRG